MTRDPATVKESDPVFRAAELMVQHDCGAIPVVEDERVVGMITDRDIVTRIVAERTDPQTKVIRDVMTNGVQTVREDEPMSRAFELMREHRIRRLPVVNDDGKLTGMLAQADLAIHTDQENRFLNTVEEISEPRELAHA